MAAGAPALDSTVAGMKNTGNIAKSGYMKLGICSPHDGATACATLAATHAMTDGAMSDSHVMSASDESRMGSTWSTRNAFSHLRTRKTLAKADLRRSGLPRRNFPQDCAKLSRIGREGAGAMSDTAAMPEITSGNKTTSKP